MISIHAPTRGATTGSQRERSGSEISIHAPTRGATVLPGATGKRGIHFNPRSHEGSDVALARAFGISVDISIHAPTRGATKFPQQFHQWESISIHAPTRGATGTHPRNTCHQNYFNPRSHEGSDKAVALFCLLFRDFNPRSHEGSDL